MYQLIDFVKCSPIKQFVTPFKTREDATGAAQSLGYIKVLPDRFLLKGEPVLDKPAYIKIVKYENSVILRKKVAV